MYGEPSSTALFMNDWWKGLYTVKQVDFADKLILQNWWKAHIHKIVNFTLSAGFSLRVKERVFTHSDTKVPLQLLCLPC